jgi:hypothetical protein
MDPILAVLVPPSVSSPLSFPSMVRYPSLRQIYPIFVTIFILKHRETKHEIYFIIKRESEKHI